MSNEIWFDPTSDKWVLSDGEHYLEVPYWARVIIADEFERETEPLKTENEKLRGVCRRLARALGIWSDWCNRDCGAEFGCDWTADGCTAAEMLRELGVEA